LNCKNREFIAIFYIFKEQDISRWKEIKPTNTDIEAVYGALYEVINRCNFMLDRADAVRKKTTDDKDLDKLDQCCGEAYFARALAYSELVKLFCKAYESDEDAAGQLGVILSEHYLGDETMRRASLKDSYQFILDDLDRAAELLELEEDFDTDTQGTLYDSIYFNITKLRPSHTSRNSFRARIGNHDFYAAI
jgi:hypothetical protein